MSKPLNCSPVTGQPYLGYTMTAERHRDKLPHESWRFNPWTYAPRAEADIASDPQGFLIQPPNEPLYATLRPVEPAPEVQDTITTTLSERGKRYGKFTGHAKITQDLKAVMHGCPKWVTLAPDQKEALEMTAHKIGRILNGDPDYDDSWVDIAGYTKLVADRLQGVER